MPSKRELFTINLTPFVFQLGISTSPPHLLLCNSTRPCTTLDPQHQAWTNDQLGMAWMWRHGVSFKMGCLKSEQEDFASLHLHNHLVGGFNPVEKY